MTSTKLANFGIKELRWWYRVKNTFSTSGTNIQERNRAFRHVGSMLMIYHERVSNKLLITAFNKVKEKTYA